MLKTTTVRVDTVKCTGKTTASVAYTLVLSGNATPGLAPPGNAVLDAGSWKATKSTICDLFALANPALTQSGPAPRHETGVRFPGCPGPGACSARRQ